MRKAIYAIFLGIISFFISFSIVISSRDSTISAQAFIDNFDKTRPVWKPRADDFVASYMVEIHSFQDKHMGYGTGVVLKADYGYINILTNEHLLGERINCIMFDGMNYSAEVIYVSEKYDAAVLRVKTNTYYAPIKINFQKPNIEEDVYSMGNLDNQGITTTKGVLCFDGDVEESPRLLSDLYTYLGCSGGALVNSDFEMIGLNCSVHVEKNLSYAIPMYALKEEICKYIF